MLAALIALVLPVSGPFADEPLFDGIGSYTRPVSKVHLAQRYFDQGLNMLFAFHHGEAKRSFRAATKHDPTCAMAWWGLALANGPHINNMQVAPDEEKEAYNSIRRALSLIGTAKPADQALIRAIRVRHAWPQPKDRGPLNRAFADEMRKVWKRFPNDPDAGALFAEAMMDLRPWDIYRHDGTPYPGTPEIVAALERVMKIRKDHPLALHLYIHAVEASTRPERAKAAADRLRDLQPGLGHNVHMPSHLDVRIGDWRKAVIANEKAMNVDAEYRAGHTPAPVYRIYMAHNNHMLAFAAIMLGQSRKAIQAVDDMVAAIPEDFQKAAPMFVDGFMAMPMEMRVRFGMWDEVLAAPDLPEYFPLARAMRHCSRAVAYAAKGMPTEARTEQALFYKARAKVPGDLTFGQNTAKDILLVATHLMNGEILVAEGRIDQAVANLRQGVTAEDKLRYSEPPDWIQPVRHPLGALLLREGRYREAEAVYRADLKKLPNNGWALLGLTKSLEAQGRDAEAAKHRAHFGDIWADADVEITSSCMCIPGK